MINPINTVTILELKKWGLPRVQRKSKGANINVYLVW